MPLIGNTVFVGDSITVGLPPFVAVDGAKTSIAKGGRSTAQIRAAVTAPEAKPLLTDARNMVALGGTNDLASGLTADGIMSNLVAIWAVGKANGMRVVAITIPPMMGYTGYPDQNAANAKRKLVNGMILNSNIPDVKVDSDAMMGDSANASKLAARFDSGDHLHPRKDAMGTALNIELAKTPSAPGPGPVPSKGPAGPPLVNSNVTGGEIVVGGALAFSVAWGLWKFAKSGGR